MSFTLVSRGISEELPKSTIFLRASEAAINENNNYQLPTVGAFHFRHKYIKWYTVFIMIFNDYLGSVDSMP